MTPMPLGLFIKKFQPKVGLGGYDIIFAYFVVEAKSKMQKMTLKFHKMVYPALGNPSRGIPNVSKSRC